jgi:hypothetical protein
MEPKKLGRTLGIGVRVASKIARDRAARAVAEADAEKKDGQGRGRAPQPKAPSAMAARVSAQGTAIGRGAKNFRQSVVTPFKKAGSVLWLEITGVFFAFFAVFFAQSVFRVHSAWRQGAEHSHFVLYILLTLLFGWFAVSSFVRARKKEKRGGN